MRHIAAVTVLLAAAVVPVADAVIINVPGDQPTIQAGIDAAVDGDEVVVAPGIYLETINFLGKVITLRSSDGPDVTTIDGRLSGTVVACVNGESPDTILDGFMITGGSSSVGAGMRIAGSSPTVRNCTFANNTATIAGGGMAVQDFSTVTVTNCSFIGNSTSSIAAGILNENFSELTVIGCTFVGNSSFVGSAINSQDFCTLIVTDSVIANNGNGAGGGSGIFALGTAVTVDRCIFSANNAGGALEVGADTLLLTNSIFIGNVGTGIVGGGVVDVTDTSLIANCLFAGNVGSIRGGGIFTGTDGDGLVVINCTFADNVPAGLTADSTSNPLVFNCVFWNNSPHQLTGDPAGRPSGASVFFSDVQGGFSGPGLNNIDADPMFVGGPSGTWTDQAVFDPVTGLTTFVDASASFVPGVFAGKALAPFVVVSDLHAIADNSATTIAIFGDFAIFGFPGAEYRIEDFNLASISPCIDAGDNTAVPEDIEADLEGNPRFLDVPATPDCQQAPGACGDLPVVDMGAYESLGGGCLAVTSLEVVCHADGTTFTVNVEGLNACTGGTSMVTFTGSGGAVGEEMCFTVLVNDDGFCCSTEICVTVPDCSPSACLCDLDADDIVGITDFLEVLAAWGTDPGGPPDFDGDGNVGIQDFLTLLANWGPCP